jgi:hypothetical protein
MKVWNKAQDERKKEKKKGGNGMYNRRSPFRKPTVVQNRD